MHHVRHLVGLLVLKPVSWLWQTFSVGKCTLDEPTAPFGHHRRQKPMIKRNIP